ncbi:hypothetical protein ACFY3N_36170 [Streptomyces sp. NPDC000348]|uniref:hypothetical protein n=1 Tax=Streptomyces sp. NPDC000348 TaxID=3364538 RepID=UPI0036CDD452
MTSRMNRLARLISVAATGAVLLVGGAAATSAVAADQPSGHASAAPAAPLVGWQKYGNFSYSQCVSWGNYLVNTGNVLAWQCRPIGLGIHELWVLR